MPHGVSRATPQRLIERFILLVEISIFSENGVDRGTAPCYNKPVVIDATVTKKIMKGGEVMTNIIKNRANNHSDVIFFACKSSL